MENPGLRYYYKQEGAEIRKTEDEIRMEKNKHTHTQKKNVGYAMDEIYARPSEIPIFVCACMTPPLPASVRRGLFR